MSQSRASCIVHLSEREVINFMMMMFKRYCTCMETKDYSVMSSLWAIDSWCLFAAQSAIEHSVSTFQHISIRHCLFTYPRRSQHSSHLLRTRPLETSRWKGLRWQ